MLDVSKVNVQIAACCFNVHTTITLNLVELSASEAYVVV